MPQPRTSQAQHDLQGTTPHDRSADQSHVPAGRPKFRKDLPADLRPIFRRISSLLEKRRTATAGDAELIRLYCFAFDRHARNISALRLEGEITTYTVLDNNGIAHEVVKTNKRLKICADTERQMASILNQLGMTPVSKDRAKPTGQVSNPSAVPGSAAWMILNGGAMEEPAPPVVIPIEPEDDDA